MIKHHIFAIIRSRYIAINMDYEPIKHSPHWIGGFIILVALNTCDINTLVKSGPAVSHAAKGSASPSFSFGCGCEETFRSVALQQSMVLGWESKSGA